MKKFALLFLLCSRAFSVQSQSWTELGGTVPGVALNANGEIRRVTSDASGNIYAMGNFQNARGYHYVAKWDGAKWTELGGTVPGVALNANDWVLQIASDPAGNIYAAGDFTDANGNAYVAKWDGSSWTKLGGTVPGIALNANGGIYSITSDVSGYIYASGAFTDSNGKYYVAKWDGTSWMELGGTVAGVALNINDVIIALTSDAAGNIYAGGYFTKSKAKSYVAKWDGTSWTELGGTVAGIALNINNGTLSLTFDASWNLYAGGYFTDSNGNYYVAKWDGSRWTELGGTVPGVALNANNAIYSVTADASGYIYASGTFTDSNGNYYVAKWDGTSWTELGGTVPGVALNANAPIISTTSDASGYIYASGLFTDSNERNYVAKIKSNTDITAIAPEKVMLGNITLYPNPTNGNISVNAPEAGTVHIYNPLGGLVTTQSIGLGNSVIALEGLAGGIYTVLFYGQGNNTYPSLKIIKE
jgi:hypothetical protein